jgi:hypothetical protein
MTFLLQQLQQSQQSQQHGILIMERHGTVRHVVETREGGEWVGGRDRLPLPLLDFHDAGRQQTTTRTEDPAWGSRCSLQGRETGRCGMRARMMGGGVEGWKGEGGGR